MIRFNCPACGATHATDHALAGELMACHGCGLPITVPVEFGTALPVVRKIPPPVDDGPLIGTPLKAKAKPFAHTQAWVAGIILLAGLWISAGLITAKSRHVAKTEPSLQVGDTLYVANIGGKNVAIATSLDALNQFQRATMAGDEIGFGKLVKSGDILLCRPGTELKLLDRGIEQHEVRVMSGSHFGASGWIDVDKSVR